MMKIKVLFPVFAAFFAAVVITSCEKKIASVTDNIDTQATLAQNDAVTDAIVENLDQSVDDQLQQIEKDGYTIVNNKSISTEITVCTPTITIEQPDTSKFPKTITLDYGDSCSVIDNNDTIVRSGKIIIVVTGRYWKAGSTRTLTFDNFYINSIKIEGTRTVTTNALNDKGNYSWTIVVENGKIIFNDTTYLTYQTNRTREWINNGTLTRLDDTISITGSESGTNINGKTYEKTVIEPLKKPFGCPVFVSGIVETKINGKLAYTVDYGNGNCDKIVTVTVGDKTKEVTIGYRSKFRRKG